MNNNKERVAIANQSVTIMEQGYYYNAHAEKIDVAAQIEKSVAQTTTFNPEKIAEITASVLAKNKTDNNTVIEVWNCSTNEALICLEGKTKIGILNFASAKNPGGGFLGGASAQEEALTRSSSLYAALSKDMEMYQYNRSRTTFLYSDYLIYSPDVVFWFDDFGKPLAQPLIADVITSPAPNRGAMLQNNRTEELAELPEVFKSRTMQVLAIAAEKQCETLVLGAWGCGVFRNNPEDVANYFATILENEFKNVFKNIVFAIYDKSKDGANFNAFETHLNKK